MLQHMIPQKCRDDLARIDACHHTQPTLAIELCMALFDEARAEQMPYVFVSAAVQYGVMMDHLGRNAEARDILFEALQAAQAAHWFNEEAKLLEQIARGYYSSGKYREAVQYWVRCADVAGKTEGEQRSWILAKIGLGQVYFALDDHTSGLQLLEEAARRLPECDDPYLDAKVKINLAVGLIRLDRSCEAKQTLLQSVDICMKHQYLDYAAESNLRLGQIEMAHGAYDLALAHFESGIVQALAVSYRWAETNLLASKAEVHFKLGHHQEAMHFIKEAQSVSIANKFQHMLIDQHYAAARYAQAMGAADIGLTEFLTGHRYEQEVYAGSISQRNKELEDNAGLRPSSGSLLVELANSSEIEAASLDEAFELICRQSCRILRVQRCAIWQLDRSKTQLECRCLYVDEQGSCVEQTMWTATMAPALFRWLSDASPLVAHDAAHHPHTWELGPTYLQAHDIKSMLVFGLQVGEQGSYILCLEIQGAQHNWSADDLTNGQQISSILERAIANDERRKYQQEIGDLNAQLLAHNAILEDKVKERTLSLEQRNAELNTLNEQLGEMQNQLLQAEKMASIGQLAAGVAHEINNPIGFVSSNVGAMAEGFEQLLSLLQDYALCESFLPPLEKDRIAKSKKTFDLDFLQEDLPTLIAESKDGIARIAKIVRDLREFSHVDSEDKGLFDINSGIKSTLNLLSSEFKGRVQVETELAPLPIIECSLGRLNQVFLNLLVNANHAIASNAENKGRIRVSSACIDEVITIKISDNGCGIKKQDMHKIFDAFFTTKPVGEGTGLGLSLSYSIIKAHQGRIEVESELGVGTTFIISLPTKLAVDV